MADNPYAPPTTRVDDVPESLPEGGFLPDGRGVRAGNGWRWIADAWAFTRGQRFVFIGVMLLVFVLQLALSLVPFLGAIASTFLLPFLAGGFLIGCEAVRHGQPLEVGYLFMGFQRHTNKLLLVGAVSFAMSIVIGVVVGLVLLATVDTTLFGSIFGGSAPPTIEQLIEIGLPLLLAVLVALALSIPMTMALLYVPALVVINDAEVLPAVRASFVACLKNVVPFLIWGLAGLAMLLVSTPVIFIGPMLVTFLLMVSLYQSYRDIFYDDRRV